MSWIREETRYEHPPETGESTTLVVHVYPTFGPVHQLEADLCWCHPVAEFEENGVVVIHNVAH